MKKSLIAASASAVALAAMPVVGVFADYTPATNPQAFVDNLTVNVDGVCLFQRTTGNGKYVRSMTANQLWNEGGTGEAFGTSTFKSACNNNNGYKVKLVATDLAQSNGDGAEITYSTTDPAAGSGTWTAYRSAVTPTGDSSIVKTAYRTAGNISVGANDYAFETTGADSATTIDSSTTSFTVVYKVSTHEVQEQGSYTGTATYTLTQNPATGS